MTIFVSVVSHRHHDVIINLGAVKQLAALSGVKVLCRDNKPVSKLQRYCKKYGIYYLANTKQQGFAANNNANFLYAKTHLNMQDDDYFILFNPDVFIKPKDMSKLCRLLEAATFNFGAVNLFLDREEMVHDDNIRLYPKFCHFVRTYLLNQRCTMIDRRKGLSSDNSYWASCSFMIVKAECYEALKGLDERYYMYCEDIDFCYRARLMGRTLHYLEDIKAVHFRRQASRVFLTRHFFWHVKSVFRYSFVSKKIEAKTSRLKQ